MSIKIYNGFALPAMSSYELMKFLQKTKKKMEKARDELIKSRYSEAEYRKCWGELWSRAKKVQQSQEFDHEADLTFELCLAPKEHLILGVPYTVQSKFYDLFFKIKEVKEYGYWDNTDRDDTIPESAWRERKNNWKELCSYDGSIADFSLTYRLLGVMPPLPDKVFKNDK